MKSPLRRLSEWSGSGPDRASPERTFATVDHIIPTDNQAEPFADATADAMIRELRRNCAENGIRFFDIPTGLQGIVHMVGPELGITQPGMTIVCGDSHTATHGAFGSIAMGIGTTQVRDVLATQTLALSPLKVRRINVNGKLAPGVRRQGCGPAYHRPSGSQGRPGLRL